MFKLRGLNFRLLYNAGEAISVAASYCSILLSHMLQKAQCEVFIKCATLFYFSFLCVCLY